MIIIIDIIFFVTPKVEQILASWMVPTPYKISSSTSQLLLLMVREYEFTNKELNHFC